MAGELETADQTTSGASGAGGAKAAACEQCGYSLSGLSASEQAPVCPECGTRFDPKNVWRPAQWPAPPALYLRLCGPAALVLVALICLGAFRGTRNLLVWPVLAMWLVAIVLVAIVRPISLAKSLAGRCEPLVTRRAVARRAWVTAVIMNLTATAVAIAIFLWML